MVECCHFQTLEDTLRVALNDLTLHVFVIQLLVCCPLILPDLLYYLYVR